MNKISKDKFLTIFFRFLSIWKTYNIAWFFLFFFISNNIYAQQTAKKSCRTLSQFLTDKASPGVNCYADCRAMPSGVTANDGVNCLFDCNNLASGVTPQPGGNCSYKINGAMMPLCTSIPSPKGYTVIQNYVIPIGTTPNPRVNCADLIDLPLCSLFSSNANSTQNCVRMCSELIQNTIDNRLHNRDCVRFSEGIEADATGKENINRRCHQFIGSGTNPTSSCEATTPAISCTNLVEQELNKSSFYSSAVNTVKFCNPDKKCLEYNSPQLDAIKTGFDAATSPKAPILIRLCKLHDCRASTDSACAPFASDDIAKISENSSYKVKYIQNIITSTFPTISTLEALCTTKICSGTIEAQFPCTIDASGNTVRDSRCNSLTCTNNYCKLSIDCNDASLSQTIKNQFCSPDSIPQSPAPTDHTNSYANLVDKTYFYLPKPMDKSYINNTPSSGYRTMQKANLCYSLSDLEANNFAHRDNVFGGLITGVMSLFTGGRNFEPVMTDYADCPPNNYTTRSPTYCNPGLRHGARGVGYMYLCGGPDFTSKPNMDFVGYVDNVSSVYTDSGSSHKVRACLRYNNSMIPKKTCGARECGVTCAWGDCSTVCGFDECRDIIISENNPRECQDPTNTSGSCTAQIGSGSDMDSYIRLRGVAFEGDNQICVMLDWRGGLAYSGIFMDGSESLPDDSTKCLSGTYDKTTQKCVNGKNSNDDKSQANIWRALGLIKYVDKNVTVNGVQGIMDVNNNFIPASSCIRRQLRSSPPNLYNLANLQNSPNLFSPPIIISSVINSKTRRTMSNPIPGQLFGSTDFNQPEVNITFGTTTENLGLDIGKNGEETGANIDPISKKTLTTTVLGKTYTAIVYVKKMYDQINGPKFCIFRELRDKSNALINPPPSIGCIKRNLPEIDNCDIRTSSCSSAGVDRTTYRKKFLLYKDTLPANNTYEKIVVKHRYMLNYSGNISSTTCGGNILCTNEISTEFNLTNKNEMSYCVSSIDGVESYPICLYRDDCSKLNMECLKNEIAYNLSPSSSIESVLSMRASCFEKLKSCNLKKNISGLKLDPSKFNAPATSNYYGWFNEVCVKGAFDHKLKIVYAHKIEGSNGKCIILPSYASNAECAEGGKMPNCPCTQFVETEAPPAHIQALDPNTITTRTETHREAGLCVDIDIAKTCPSISYTEPFTIDQSDPNFIANSIGKTFYNNATGVHQSHQTRSSAIATTYGNAEFSSTIVGSTAPGQCVGFWKYKNQFGTMTPELRCITNASGQATWNASLESPSSVCIRYTCPLISLPILDNSTGLYSNYYASSEVAENKGAENGNAHWPAYTHVNDFAISIDATNCITGFKKISSTTNFSYPASVNIASSLKTLANASLFGAITSYSSGTNPSRMCNQVGQWQTALNSCQRIYCPAINPGTAVPLDADNKKLWEESWSKSGGAKFNTIPASRSSTETITFLGLNSRQTGTCENALGYYQPLGGVSPTLDCDSLGNWKNLQNQCLTDCDSVTRASTNEANGWSTWPTTSMTAGELSRLVSGSCSDTNYFNYPYPPRRNDKGEKYTLVESSPNYSTSIPIRITSDTRATSVPKRTCINSLVSGLNRSQWSPPSSTCVTVNTGASDPNGCVTGAISSSLMSDERIGAGVTEHSIIDGNGAQQTIRISWDRRKFGEYQIKYCDSSNNFCQNTNASSVSHNANNYYSPTRSTNFVVARYCNTTTKKWDDPVAYCVASGSISGQNASVSVGGTSMDSGTHYILSTGSSIAMTCDSGYAPLNGNVPYLRCDTNSNLNRYNLVKSDGNSCVKFCDVNGDGTIPGTSYSYLRGSAGRYYSGNTTTFTCTGNPCGGQSVTATCSDSGWSIPAPSCRGCYNCNSSSANNLTNDPTTISSVNSGNVKTVLTRTITQSCIEERASVKCLLLKAQASTNLYRRNSGGSTSSNLSFPTINHGGIIRVANHRGGHCSAFNTNYQQVCVQSVFSCNDGTFEYYWDESNRGDCNYDGEYEDNNNSMDVCITNDVKFVNRSVSDRSYRNVGCYNYNKSGNPYEIFDDCLK